MKKFLIIYANGQREEVTTEESREQLFAQCKPIIDVVEVETENASQEPSPVSSDEGGGSQPKAGKAKGNKPKGG